MKNFVHDFLIGQISVDCRQIKHHAAFVGSRADAISQFPSMPDDAALAEIERAEIALTEALLCVKLARVKVARMSAEFA